MKSVPRLSPIGRRAGHLGNRLGRAPAGTTNLNPLSGSGLIACLLVLVVEVGGCGKPSMPQPTPSSQDRPTRGDFVLPDDAKGVATAPARLKTIGDFLEVAARIQADPTRVVRVFPPVGGRLLTVQVRPGDHVRQGQTLAVLESSEISAARADYQKARADAAVKENALRRASLLFENQVLAEKEYQQAQADAEVAQAELGRARERLRILGVEPEGSSDQLRVPAPRAGVVLDIGAAPGELSRSLDSPAPLATLADLSTVWVIGDVYEKDLASVKVGQPADVTVNAYPGERFTGKVVALSDTVDPATRTLKLRVALANPGWRLKPEMFASIRLLRAAKACVVVPASAVVREGDSSYVFVERSPGRFERRSVTLGKAVGDSELQVTSGLKAGEVVVAEGALLLRLPVS